MFFIFFVNGKIVLNGYFFFLSNCLKMKPIKKQQLEQMSAGNYLTINPRVLTVAVKQHDFFYAKNLDA